ncbi:MAG: hypothetical protein HYZ53_04390 [Planctomycetes bacterium]|nr:hypothetical protein [Planctomycetota bacterium]
MRGNALADPTVVGLLQPFIVTFWYGHRDDNPPPELREYIDQAGGRPAPGAAPGAGPSPGGPGLGPGPGAGGGGGGAGGGGPAAGRSNVKLVVLDSRSRFVDAWDSMPGRGWNGPWQETMPRYFADRLRRVRETLGLHEAPGAPRELRLPDRSGAARAIRIFVRLDDPGMPAYFAPVVEIVEPPPETWKALEYPEAARTLGAEALLPCFRKVYPPGVMERQNKQTMFAWRVARADGPLTLEPAGTKDGTRYSLLRGTVRLTDEGPDGFSFEGPFTAVLTYAAAEPAPRSLRATFDAVYPRADRAHGVTRRFPLTAVFESRMPE